MTAEHLTAYIQDESYLYTLNYEELKTLVMQYPYATNLRVLLLKKSQLDDLKDYERNLQMVATYTTNRKYLYAMTKRLKSRRVLPQNVILGEEFLELTALSNIERLIIEKEALSTTIEAPTPKLAADWTLEFSTIEEEKTVNQEQKDREDEVVAAILELKKPAQIIDNQFITSDADIDALINNIVLDMSEDEPTTTESVEDNSTPELEIVASPSHSKKVLDLTFEPPPADKDAEWLSIFDTAKAETPPSVFEPIKTGSKTIAPIQASEFVEERAILANLFKEMDAAEASLSLAESDFAVVAPEVEDKSVWELTENLDDEKIELAESLEGEKIELVENLEDEKKGIEPVLEATTPTETAQIVPQTPPQYTAAETPKKPNFELEILNEDRATIVETTTEKTPTKGDNDASSASFTEWLRQFKMNTPSSSLQITRIQNPKAQEIGNQSVMPPVVIEYKSATPAPISDVSDTSKVSDTYSKQEEKIIEETATVTKSDASRFIGSIEFLFENQDPLPDNVLGMEDDQPSISRKDAENLVKKALNTEGGKNEGNAVKKSESNDAETTQEGIKKKKKKVLHELAAKSIVLDDTVMSETLANILASQGNKDKANEMYRRLALAFPEKSGYFAAKIEALSHPK